MRTSGREGTPADGAAGDTGCYPAALGVSVIDVPGVDFLVVVESVVGFGLVGAGLPEDLAAQGVREEGFDIRRVGGHHQIQQVRRRRVIGDQIGGGIADAEVKNLHAAWPLAGSHFPGALGHLIGVARPGDEDAYGTVEHLVHTVQHQILVM